MMTNRATTTARIMAAPVRSGRWAGRVGAPAFFGASHGPGIGFVIVAHQVKHAVQHEDLDFLLDRVAEFTRLGAGAPQGDGDVAEERTAPDPRGVPRSRLCWEREHVGRVVLAAEVAIEAAELGVAGDQGVERAPLANFLFQRAGEASDRRPPQTCRDPTEPDATAFGRGHGAPQASGAVSVGGISTLTSPFPFPFPATGSASGRVSWRPAPMAS